MSVESLRANSVTVNDIRVFVVILEDFFQVIVKGVISICPTCKVSALGILPGSQRCKCSPEPKKNTHAFRFSCRKKVAKDTTWWPANAGGTTIDSSVRSHNSCTDIFQGVKVSFVIALRLA